MTSEEAIRILHPNTTKEALVEYEYYGGFNGKKAMIKAVDEASILACEALQKVKDIDGFFDYLINNYDIVSEKICADMSTQNEWCAKNCTYDAPQRCCYEEYVTWRASR